MRCTLICFLVLGTFPAFSAPTKKTTSKARRANGVYKCSEIAALLNDIQDVHREIAEEAFLKEENNPVVVALRKKYKTPLLKLLREGRLWPEAIEKGAQAVKIPSGGELVLIEARTGMNKKGEFPIYEAHFYAIGQTGKAKNSKLKFPLDVTKIDPSIRGKEMSLPDGRLLDFSDDGKLMVRINNGELPDEMRFLETEKNPAIQEAITKYAKSLVFLIKKYGIEPSNIKDGTISFIQGKQGDNHVCLIHRKTGEGPEWISLRDAAPNKVYVNEEVGIYADLTSAQAGINLSPIELADGRKLTFEVSLEDLAKNKIIYKILVTP